MKYFIGCARSKDCLEWERIDDLFSPITYGGKAEFDHEMIYFPAAVKVSETKAYVFYAGNYFGRDGMGVIAVNF